MNKIRELLYSDPGAPMSDEKLKYIRMLSKDQQECICYTEWVMLRTLEDSNAINKLKSFEKGWFNDLNKNINEE